MYNKNQSGDALAWIYIGTSVYLESQAIKKRDELLKYLEAEPLNPERHQDFLNGLKKLKRLGSPNSGAVYNCVLEIFINNPDNRHVKALVFKTGQWYFSIQEPPKRYSPDDLSQIESLLDKKKEIENLITCLDDNSDEGFLEASKWIESFEFSAFDDNLVKHKVVDIKDSFFKKYSSLLLQKITDNPADEDLQLLFKSTLKSIDRPDPDLYETFLVSLLNDIVLDPKNKDFKDFLMHSLEKAPGIAGVSSLNIYNTVLDLFEMHCSQKDLRTLVLDIGRWHFSRKNWLRRRPKPEDEQQMQNDILMRLHN